MSTREPEPTSVEQTAERAAAHVRGLLDRPGLRRIAQLAQAAELTPPDPAHRPDARRRPGGPPARRTH
jgi:hypothetical protein